MDTDRAERLMESGLVSVADAQRFLSVSRRTVYKLIRTGDLPSVRIGRRRLIPKRALRVFGVERLE